MRVTAVVVCLYATGSLCVGCGAGHTVRPSEFEYVHPAVQWVYAPGNQLFISTVLFLPMEASNKIIGGESGDESVTVIEQATSTPEMTLWCPSQKQRRVLSLADGTLLRSGISSGSAKQFEAISMQYDEGHHQEITRLSNGWIVATRIVESKQSSKGSSSQPSRRSDTSRASITDVMTIILVGRDEEHLHEVMHCYGPMSGMCFAGESHNRLLLVFPGMLLCIDETRLPE